MTFLVTLLAFVAITSVYFMLKREGCHFKRLLSWKPVLMPVSELLRENDVPQQRHFLRVHCGMIVAVDKSILTHNRHIQGLPF